jgi:hypothetical protein
LDRAFSGDGDWHLFVPPRLCGHHGENSNGKLDTNLLGIPTEGYGFSNNATALIGTPSFSDASFFYKGQTLNRTITLALLSGVGLAENYATYVWQSLWRA